MGLIGAKPSKEKVSDIVVVPVVGGALGKAIGIVEHLAADRWEDGAPRTPSTLSVFIEAGRVKVSLNDRAMSRSTYVSGDSLEACLKAIEGHLQAGDVEWRSWKGKR